MKTFIIFTGIMLMFLEFAMFQSDMNRYARDREQMDALALDCAEFAARHADCGDDAARCREAAAYGMSNVLRVAEVNMGGMLKGHIEMDVEFPEQGGSGEAKSFGRRAHAGRGDRVGKTAIVRLKAETEDYFRLPFLSATHLEGRGEYVGVNPAQLSR